MAIKKNNDKSGAAGILSGIKAAKENMNNNDASSDIINNDNEDGREETKNKNSISEVQEQTEEDSTVNKYLNVANMLESAKQFIQEDDEPVRRTFTIDAISHTQLNELKVYILPALNIRSKKDRKFNEPKSKKDKRNPGYNEIVNIAIQEYYERQKKSLLRKLHKRENED